MRTRSRAKIVGAARQEVFEIGLHVSSRHAEYAPRVEIIAARQIEYVRATIDHGGLRGAPGEGKPVGAISTREGSVHSTIQSSDLEMRDLAAFEVLAVLRFPALEVRSACLSNEAFLLRRFLHW